MVPAVVASTEDKVQTSIREQWLVCKDGVIVYPNTRFFGRSNQRTSRQRAEFPEENLAETAESLCDARVRWGEVFLKEKLPSELNRNVRSCGNARAGWGRLLPRQAAAYGFQLQPGILCSFHGAAHGLADK